MKIELNIDIHEAELLLRALQSSDVHPDLEKVVDEQLKPVINEALNDFISQMMK